MGKKNKKIKHGNWISVNKNIPEVGEEVKVLLRYDNEERLGKRVFKYHSSLWIIKVGPVNFYSSAVTHWKRRKV